MPRLLAAFALALLAGCASVEDARKAQGSGEKRTYAVTFERAWNVIPYAITEGGGKVKQRNREAGYVLAEYGVSLTSLGERVAVFCQRKGANEVEIEVVSKEAFALNIAATDWTSRIFASLERQLKP